MLGEKHKKMQQNEFMKEDGIDEYLQYGNYQASRVWLIGSLLGQYFVSSYKIRCVLAAFAGAFSYAHPVFLLADPPDWRCEDENAAPCNPELRGETVDRRTHLLLNLSHFRSRQYL